MKNENGYFGEFGGIYLPSYIEKILLNLAEEYEYVKKRKAFRDELKRLYRTYANRPSLLYFAERFSTEVGCKVYLKREDLNHTGAHKINNVIGQGLLAKHLGKKRIIAETGAGQHGVAAATIAAYLGIQCDVYMGERDICAQKPNVYRMKMLGARVVAVLQGQGTLKDAIDAALENYLRVVDKAYYMLGSAVGPHPYPIMVRDFQKVVGEEIAFQLRKTEGRMPTSIVACIGGGSNALGAFYRFIDKKDVELVAVEPAGKGRLSGRHGLVLGTGVRGEIHGYKSLVMKDKKGRIKKSYSAASGLDYPGVSPELSMLKRNGRLTLGEATDKEAVEAFVKLSRLEGVIPALESAHAVAYLLKNKKKYKENDIVVINLSGRGGQGRGKCL
ncbi:MAG: tryptophan synthase subunit beta [Candidatus Dojkabacteria bacterium]|nr:tryptophan synthase subunit beta [Candidatus Dojkabacteria bacterium]